MKLSVKPNQLKWIILGAGGLGFLLRVLLYTTGTDEKGLLVSGHWAVIALGILTLAVAAGLFLLTKPIQGPQRYQDCFPVSWVSAAGAILAALGILVTTVSGIGSATDTIELVIRVLGFVSVAALAVVAVCRLTGAKPVFPCHAVVCVYFALRMVSQYRHWSADPQLQDYCFYLFAYGALMLAAYQQAAFDAGMGSHRALWVLNLASVYLCFLALYGCQDALLLFTAGIWAFTNLTALKAKPRRQRPALVLDEQPPQEA